MSPSRPHLTFIFPYHNNVYDTVRALQRQTKVTFLTPKTLRHSIYLKEGIDLRRVRARRWPLLGRVYDWHDLWRNTERTTHVVLKHFWLPENIVPLLVAWRRGAKVLVMLQQLPVPWLASVVAQLLGIQLFSVLPSTVAPYLPAVIDPTRFVRPGKAASALRLLCVAKYQRRKNIEVLLAAIGTLKKNHSQLTVRLRIVGMVVDQGYADELVQQINRLGLTGCVTLETHTTNPQIQQYLAASDIVVLPATHEPLGYIVLEAMAAGRPVITTHDVGAAAYVADGVSGYVVSPGSVPHLVSALEQFISGERPKQAAIAAAGQAGRELVDKYHTPAVFWRDFKTLM